MQPVHVLLERLCDLGLPASADEALRGRIRAEQIGGTLRLSPLSMGANIMNAVVLTAVLSCLNSGLYTSSRMLFVLARRGEAPAALLKTSRRGVPSRSVRSARR